MAIVPERTLLALRISFTFISGTIAPAREIPKEDTIQIILANLNLVVPVVAAVLVIIVAITVICVLRGKSNYNKGKILCVC